MRDCVDMYMNYRKGLSDAIRATEKIYPEAPTDKDIHDTYKLLRNYKIKIKLNEIPRTNTYGDLERWRRKVIKEHLDKYED